jgi:hypothetical protein
MEVYMKQNLAQRARQVSSFSGSQSGFCEAYRLNLRNQQALEQEAGGRVPSQGLETYYMLIEKFPHEIEKMVASLEK